MKLIFRIAKTELATLFYSPIAWLILIVFACQVGLNYIEILDTISRMEAMGRQISFSVTAGLLLGSQGLYETIQSSLYMYIPLLTMGLLSREYASGSIKLLYSSPVTSLQIILGKYLSMVIYSMVLALILFFPVVHIMFAVPLFDIGLAMSGVLGLFLLVCVYCAIGLYMSSLTSYQVVAAVATFSALAFLNFVGDIGQEYAFIREITYWLSISGRASNFVSGVVCSGDVIYFVSVVAMFLSFATFKLSNEKSRISRIVSVSKYVGAIVIVMTMGYISSRPAMLYYYDATQTKARTLSVGSQEIVNQLKGGLTITTFCNILDSDFDIAAPSSVKNDEDRFKEYLRFKPEIKLKYIYYYAPPVDTSIYGRYPNKSIEEIAREVAKKRRFNFKKLKSPEEIAKIVDLAPEEYRFVRMLERESGERSFLRIYNDMFRHPGEAEITASMKKLFVKPIKIGFIVGHGERDVKKGGDGDYSLFSSSLTMRSSLLNQGFDLTTIDLNTIDDIDSDINILLIADMRSPLTEKEQKVLDKYIARGDNLFILTDVGRQESMNPILKRFGVEAQKGIIVQPSELFAPNLITSFALPGSDTLGRLYANMQRYGQCITMLGAVALEIKDGSEFKHIPMLGTDSNLTWIDYETINFVDDTVKINPAIGEYYSTFLTSVAAMRNVGEKEQRVLILGDADCISNSELMLNNRKGIRSVNYSMIPTTLRWMSHGIFPVNVGRNPNIDTKISTTPMNILFIKIIFIWAIPIILAIIGIAIWLRRRMR